MHSSRLVQGHAVTRSLRSQPPEGSRSRRAWRLAAALRPGGCCSLQRFLPWLKEPFFRFLWMGLVGTAGWFPFPPGSGLSHTPGADARPGWRDVSAEGPAAPLAPLPTRLPPSLYEGLLEMLLPQSTAGFGPVLGPGTCGQWPRLAMTAPNPGKDTALPQPHPSPYPPPIGRP